MVARFARERQERARIFRPGCFFRWASISVGRLGRRLVHHEVADARQHFHGVGRAHEFAGALGGIGTDRGVGIAPDVERRHLDRCRSRPTGPCWSDTRRAPLRAPRGLPSTERCSSIAACGHALAEQALAQAPRIVRQQQLAGLGLEERAVMARAMLLVAVFLRSARRNDSGCGRDRMVSEASRSGCASATPHDTCPPQSWPTRWKRLPS